MLFPVNQAGEFGVIKDMRPEELAPNVWTSALNMRAIDGAMRRVEGYQSIWGTPAVAPYHIAEIANSTSAPYWVWLGLGKAYSWNGAAHTNITRSVGGDYAATADEGWTSTVLGGIPVFTNGVDVPQQMAPAVYSTLLVPLSNWPASTYCRSIKAFKNFLIAMHITKTTTVYPYMIKWSHPAVPGAVPTSWDETDPTKDAGERDLAETTDKIVDGAVLRDVFAIYKENSIWGLQYIQGTQIFRSYRMLGQAGILAKRCMAELRDGSHAVFGDDDCYVFDGQNAVSLLTKKMRRWLFSQLDVTYYKRSFVVFNRSTYEVMFAFCPNGVAFPTIGVVVSLRDLTVTVRELPGVTHGVAGNVVVAAAETFDAQVGTWDSDSAPWDSAQSAPNSRILMTSPQNTKLELLDYDNTANSGTFSSYLERTGLGIPIRSNRPPDYSTMKFIREVWPRLTGDTGQTVLISVGGQMGINEAVTWAPAVPYVIGSQQKIDVRVTTRIPAIRFEAVGSFSWELQGYELEFTPGGLY